jgi:hypothetical protein
MEQTMQQMMACLLAEIRPSQEHLKEETLTKTEANLRETRADMLAKMETKKGQKPG